MTGPFGTTAGPWKWDGQQAIDNGLEGIATVAGWFGGAEANARAIAQVPAMLALVERVMLTANNPSHDDALDDIENLAAMARAIARELEEK